MPEQHLCWRHPGSRRGVVIDEEHDQRWRGAGRHFYAERRTLARSHGIDQFRQQIVAELEESAHLTQWLAANLAEGIAEATAAIVDAYRVGGKVLLCGNGGSAADSQHLAAELLGRFRQERAPLAAVALTTDTSVLTAVSNDTGFEHVFARQVEALIAPQDVLVAISTSGNSPNVLEAVVVARKHNAKTIGLVGRDGGKLARLVDIPLVVRAEDAARIQECHITIGHTICGVVERELFGG